MPDRQIFILTYDNEIRSRLACLFGISTTLILAASRPARDAFDILFDDGRNWLVFGVFVTQRICEAFRLLAFRLTQYPTSRDVPTMILTREFICLGCWVLELNEAELLLIAMTMLLDSGHQRTRRKNKRNLGEGVLAAFGNHVTLRYARYPDEQRIRIRKV